MANKQKNKTVRMVKKLEEGVDKLIGVESHEEVIQLLEMIASLKESEKVTVATRSTGGNKLMWGSKCMFTFDTCRCGNANHNAISIIRDLLKKHNPQGKWTRKKVESSIHFEPWTHESKKAV